MKSLSEQMGTVINLLTTVLPSSNNGYIPSACALERQGLHQHAEELKTFLSLRNIDIMLISETHFTDKSYLRIHNYAV
jgi:hypothetical protein